MAEREKVRVSPLPDDRLMSEFPNDRHQATVEIRLGQIVDRLDTVIRLLRERLR